MARAHALAVLDIETGLWLGRFSTGCALLMAVGFGAAKLAIWLMPIAVGLAGFDLLVLQRWFVTRRRFLREFKDLRGPLGLPRAARERPLPHLRAIGVVMDRSDVDDPIGRWLLGAPAWVIAALVLLSFAFQVMVASFR
jgi:hypothetical protein